MGKKGSWFSAIKRVFVSNSKERQLNGSEKKNTKEKKKGRGILKHGETKSFMPLFREPSSIEKILGEAEQQQILRPPTPAEQPKITPLLLPSSDSPTVASQRVGSPRVTSPQAASPRVTSPQSASPWVTSPKVASSRAIHHHKEVSYRPEPTLRYHHHSAIKIQAAYRGYMARRNFRALRGLVRLQGVVRGQNVKRQTVNAMKMMQLLVRVQTQIQSRRIQMLENQAFQRQAYKDKELEGSLSKFTANQSESGAHEDWDDSLLTKEEIEASVHRKVEAVIKRERAMAYAYSHQLWKANPKSTAQTSLMDIRSGGFPWWWNWLERQLPPANPPESKTTKGFNVTPPRPTLEPKPSPRPAAFSSYKQHNNIGLLDNLDTPRSTRSAVPPRTKHPHTPSNRTPPLPSSSIHNKFSKARAESAFVDTPLKDDDSLMSCPPFSVPNYMTPTMAAKAKVRATSNPKDRFPGTPVGSGVGGGGGSESKRRFSFPLTPNIGSFKWNRGSSKDSTSQMVLEKHQPLQSIGDLSIDSAVSMPATGGRKPFNRFV